MFVLNNHVFQKMVVNIIPNPCHIIMCSYDVTLIENLTTKIVADR